MAGQDGSLLIGIDLVKDRDVLKAAYNERAASRPRSISEYVGPDKSPASRRLLSSNAFRHLAIYNGPREPY